MYDQKQCLNLKKKSPLNLAIHTIMLGITLGSSAVSYAAESDNENVTQLPVIKVQAEAEPEKVAFKGNMDLVRSEDDSQPYQIIDRKVIENSGATSVEELLSKVSSMVTSVSNETAGGWTGSSSQINLRGLGTSHTLVLINGRKGAGVGSRGSSESTDQQNINGIPLAAIERIEILPSSASAIYGSNALGGVINVVLRRDFVGTEANIRYDNTFDTDVALKTVNLTTGFALEGGRTQVLFTAQKQEGNELKVKDRSFFERDRAVQLEKNPSAIYGGNPPMGNLTNIKTVDGSELIAGSGASYAYVPKGYQGAAIDGLTPFYDTVGQYALGLANGIGSDSGAQNLVGAKENQSYTLNINRDFTDKLNIFLEGGYEEQKIESAGNYHGFGTVTIKADNPTNPFGKDILVTYSPSYDDGIAMQNRNGVTETKRVATGFEYEPIKDWRIIGDYAWSNTRNDLRYQRRSTVGQNKLTSDINSGALDFLRDVTTYGIDLDQGYWSIAPNFTDQTTQSYNLRTHAPIFDWYAGKIYLAAGLGHTKWESDSRSETSAINDPNAPITYKESTNDSAYAELTIPFISPEMKLPWAKLLEVTAAGRYERFDLASDNRNGTVYSADFNATTPAFSFKFAPNDTLMFRGSYGEGFIAPTVSQLRDPELSTSLTAINDPVTGERVQIYTTGGGNPELEPENAKSYGAGFVFTPQFLPDFRLSVDYFKIKKSNNITSLNAQAIVTENAASGRYADRIIRDADGNLDTVNISPFNALWMETSGIDTQLAYAFDSAIGRLNLNAGYTWTQKYLQQESIDAEPIDYLNDPASDGPLKQRVNASAYLQANDKWGFGWSMQYYGKYKLKDETSILLQGSDTVASQTYHDVFARYKMPKAISAKYGSPELTFGIKNLFKDYEVDMSQTYISKYTDPRLRQYYLNLKFNF
ncbi:TonB-dependent receptor [Acinetobacter populi]|uniref:TonB-dependent receptor n=1 Tax=Acinetobacter populi TaxID=1582270 RepID=A0A1Z9YYA6_9GAMM|nr:TonB-dependent receptor [Acinetobacter populi]OUY07201.1 hypothetical protein CAP51_11010 [Acinetobacter populi]